MISGVSPLRRSPERAGADEMDNCWLGEGTNFTAINTPLPPQEWGHRVVEQYSLIASALRPKGKDENTSALDKLQHRLILGHDPQGKAVVVCPRRATLDDFAGRIHLEVEAAALQNEVNRLRLQVSMMREQYEVQMVKAREAAVEDQLSEIETLKREREHLSQQNATLLEEGEKMRVALWTKEEDLSRAQRRPAELTSGQIALKQENEQLTASLEDTKRRLSRCMKEKENEHTQGHAELLSRISELEGLNQKLVDVARELEKHLEATMQRVDELEGRLQKERENRSESRTIELEKKIEEMSIYHNVLLAQIDAGHRELAEQERNYQLQLEEVLLRAERSEKDAAQVGSLLASQIQDLQEQLLVNHKRAAKR